MKTLATDKGNFLVNNEGICAFFDKSGKFLREASLKEWIWAEGRMAETDTNIIFDFSSIIEKNRKKRQEDLNALITFAGQENAKKIISFFGKEPSEFKIAGQMSPDWQASAVCTGGCFYSHREWAEAWAIEDGGIKSIKSIMTQEDAEQNANGSSSDAYGFTADYLANNSDADYFIIHDGYRYLTDQGSNNEIDENDTWAIYRRPNMEPLWEELEEMANMKLNDFFVDIKQISNRDKSAFYAVVRSLISNPEITNTNFEAIERNWFVSAVSEYGEMYSDRNEYMVWAVNKDCSLKSIQAIAMVTEEEREMMADYEPTPYGYDFSHLNAEAPEALFFIMKEEHERHAERQPSATSNAWYLLRVLSRKELMIKKINSENGKKYTFGDLIPVR